MKPKADYIGRFAPSPSGPLHFGSLIAALASFLDARANHGLWLLRMEDLDPGREPPQAAGQILEALEAFGLQWDGQVLYQSSRLAAYRDALQRLQQEGYIYACDCTRQQIQAMGGVYDNRCRNRTDMPQDCALRVRVADRTIHFEDQIQGATQQHLMRECGDFVLLRKDGLFAYQLAVVVDDAFQNISSVVRGSDLLDSTPRQIFLQQCLGFATPQYAHIPVAVNEDNQKLSKQHFATPLDHRTPLPALLRALVFLGQPVTKDMTQGDIASVLHWAIANWDIQAVPKLANIQFESVEQTASPE
jgi:glutamyl-Q tRNA(Asp) synthetase